MKKKWKNWTGNQTAKTEGIFVPKSEDEITSLIGKGVANRWKIRPVGSSHSFNSICVTDGLLISLDHFSKVVDVNSDRLQVTAGGGITLSALNIELDKHGLALPNLGDIDSQTLAGAISTGTHGTGKNFSSISAAVVGIRIATGDGAIIEVSKSHNPEILDSARVSLGALGIIISVTLQCIESFNLESLELTDSLSSVLERFEHEDNQSDFVEFFWYPHTEIAELKINNRTTDLPTRNGNIQRFLNDEILRNASFGFLNKYWRYFPSHVPGILNKALKVGDSRIQIDRSYRVFCSKRRVKFLEMEYAIPRECLLEVFKKVQKIIENLSTPITFPIEVRSLGPDDIPLSPAFGRNTGYIAVHVYKGADHSLFFSQIENLMRDYEGRPHWGKLHTLSSRELMTLYPEWEKFALIRKRLDPDSHFSNDYLERVLGY